MNAAHSRLAPSSASRWVHCPASVRLEAQFTDRSSAADAGEASHWVGAEMLSTGVVHNPGEVAPNGVVLDMEMVHGAQMYTKAVANAAPPGTTLYVEQKIAVAGVHAQCFGTPDLFYYIPQSRELHLWDYKYGWLIVEVVNNWQLTCYAAGLLEWLAGWMQRGYGEVDQETTVVFHIAQPRPYHQLGPVREWRVNGAYLRAAINRLRMAAEVAMGPDPQACSGAHCLYCKARHGCLTAQAAGYAAFEYAETANFQNLTPEALGRELAIVERAQEIIKARLTGLTAQAQSLLERGASVPGYSLERKAGQSAWTVPAEQIFTMGDMVGVDVRKPQEPVTPLQALAAGYPEELVTAFSTRNAGSPKLVRSSTNITAAIFGPAAAERGA